MINRNPDFCGVETPTSQLSGHFTQHNVVTRERNIQENDASQNNIPNSFNMNILFNNLEQVQKNHQINSEIQNKITDHNPKENSDQLKYNPQPIFTPHNFNVPTNIPISMIPQNSHKKLAQKWAESELSKFENKIISLEEIQKMSDAAKRESEIRFSDVVREIAREEADEDEKFGDSNISGIDNDIWENIKKSIEESQSGIPSQDPKLIEIPYQANNHYLKQTDGMTENEKRDAAVELVKKGMGLFNRGYFSEASLVLEAVVQLDNELEVAWYYLGLSYSENEQDDKALLACQKCLGMNDKNREIMLSMARIYCNEINIDKTVHYLEKWLLSHPKYSHLSTVAQDMTHATPDYENDGFGLFDETYDMMILSNKKAEILQQQLEAAQKLNSEQVSSADQTQFQSNELDIVCGTFYHVMQDYDKSAEYFQKAVNNKISESPAQLWNKLGTAYCNSGQLEKSIEAYQKALELAPGFSRAACNMGVAYYNMEKYEDCIRSALKAYKLQHSRPLEVDNDETEVNSQDGSLFSHDPIWSLVRLANFKLNKPELDLSIFSKDVETLCSVFGV